MNVTPLVLQVYFRNHSGSLDNPNIDTQSEIMYYHSDFLIGSIFQIGSPIEKSPSPNLRINKINDCDQAKGK